MGRVTLLFSHRELLPAQGGMRSTLWLDHVRVLGFSTGANAAGHQGSANTPDEGDQHTGRGRPDESGRDTARERPDADGSQTPHDRTGVRFDSLRSRQPPTPERRMDTQSVV
jgi:hypothetical protein